MNGAAPEMANADDAERIRTAFVLAGGILCKSAPVHSTASAVRRLDGVGEVGFQLDIWSTDPGIGTAEVLR